MLCCSPLGNLLSPSLAKCIYDVITCTYLPLMIMIALALIIVAYDYRSFDFHPQVCPNKQYFQDGIHVSFWNDYNFDDLSLR